MQKLKTKPKIPTPNTPKMVAKTLTAVALAGFGLYAVLTGHYTFGGWALAGAILTAWNI